MDECAVKYGSLVLLNSNTLLRNSAWFDMLTVTVCSSHLNILSICRVITKTQRKKRLCCIVV
jgi:hypothetical protein